MLKIGTVKWKGRCARHPMYDPDADGPGAIKGGCVRCQDLFTIYENHQRTLKLMRAFGSAVERRRQPAADPNAGRQQSLFG